MKEMLMRLRYELHQKTMYFDDKAKKEDIYQYDIITITLAAIVQSIDKILKETP